LSGGKREQQQKRRGEGKRYRSFPTREYLNVKVTALGEISGGRDSA